MDQGSKAIEQMVCLWDHILLSRPGEQRAGCGCRGGGSWQGLAHEGSSEHKEAGYYSERSWWKMG